MSILIWILLIVLIAYAVSEMWVKDNSQDVRCRSREDNLLIY
jgi:hypothetical protein